MGWAEEMIYEDVSVNERFHLWLHFRYGLKPEQVRPTGTPGYWETIEPCGGRAGGCRQPIHGFLGCEGPMRHTIRYLDPGRDERGRWTSPYTTWRLARKKAAHD